MKKLATMIILLVAFAMLSGCFFNRYKKPGQERFSETHINPTLAVSIINPQSSRRRA